MTGGCCLSSSGSASSRSQSYCSRSDPGLIQKTLLVRQDLLWSAMRSNEPRGFGILAFTAIVAVLKVNVSRNQIEISYQYVDYLAGVLANRIRFVKQQAHLFAQVVSRLGEPHDGLMPCGVVASAAKGSKSVADVFVGGVKRCQP
jgi:hypothetical protein